VLATESGDKIFEDISSFREELKKKVTHLHKVSMCLSNKIEDLNKQRISSSMAVNTAFN